jgi:hypothetical protein
MGVPLFDGSGSSSIKTQPIAASQQVRRMDTVSVIPAYAHNKNTARGEAACSDDSNRSRGRRESVTRGGKGGETVR